MLAVGADGLAGLEHDVAVGLDIDDAGLDAVGHRASVFVVAFAGVFAAGADVELERAVGEGVGRDVEVQQVREVEPGEVGDLAVVAVLLLGLEAGAEAGLRVFADHDGDQVLDLKGPRRGGRHRHKARGRHRTGQQPLVGLPARQRGAGARQLVGERISKKLSAGGVERRTHLLAQPGGGHGPTRGHHSGHHKRGQSHQRGPRGGVVAASDSPAAVGRAGADSIRA